MNLPQPFTGENDLINVIVETPRGSRMKYNYYEQSGLFRMDKLLPADAAFPLDFGFIPGTKGEDGDPLDVLVLFEQPTYPGILMECRVLGILEAKQRSKGEKGFIQNDRLLAVPDISHQYTAMKSMNDVDKKLLESINHFFSYYHSVAGGEVMWLGTKDAATAISKIKAAQL